MKDSQYSSLSRENKIIYLMQHLNLETAEQVVDRCVDQVYSISKEFDDWINNKHV
jgi:hypothetical protein